MGNTQQLAFAFCSDGISAEPAFLALCQIQLNEDGSLPEWIPLVPKGDADGLIEALDGRKFRNTDPQDVVDAFNSDPRDLPLDWEHATEVKAPEGEMAPAAAWIDKAEIRNDGEIWGHVKEWTARGGESVSSKEYRYISPAFMWEKATKVIKKIISAGLTNRPAFDMPALARRERGLAAVWTTAYVNDLPDSAFLYIESGGEKDEEGKTKPRSLRHFPYKDSGGKVDLPHLRNAIARIPQARISGLSAADKQTLQEKARRLLKNGQGATARTEDTMDPEKLAALLGLGNDATDDQIEDAIKKLQAGPEAEVKDLQQELETTRSKLKETETELANARSASPSLDKYVPRVDYDRTMARVKELEAEGKHREQEAHDKEADAAIKEALEAGKITPATKDYYRSNCSTAEGLQAFREFAELAAPIGDPSGLDKKKPPRPETQVSQEELAIASNFGMTPEEYAKEKASDTSFAMGAIS